MTDDVPTAQQVANSEAYRSTRERITALVSDASADALDAIAPATPTWRARDVLAHVVGVAADVVGGNVADAGGDDWTAVQVDARRGRSVDEMLEEWAESGAKVDAFVLALPPAITGQLIADTVTHEHDLRHAFGVPGARDSDAFGIGVAWTVDVLGRMYDDAGEPALRFELEGGTAVAGTSETAITLRTTTFELGRSIFGRRTLDEIRAYEWTPAAAAEQLLALPPFTARSVSLGE